MKGNYIFPDSSLISFFAVHGIKGFQDEIHVQERSHTKEYVSFDHFHENQKGNFLSMMK